MGKAVATPSKREFDLDPYRGVVCLWLMVMHLCWLSEVHDALLRLFPSNIPELALHLRLGVESFLVLAGFMVAHMLRPVPGETVQLRAYFLRRCYRLLLPFAIAVLLAAADKWLAYFVFGGGHGRPGVFDILSQMFLVNELFGVPEAASGYWTLAALEQSYLLGLAALGLVWWLTRGDRETAYRKAVTRMGPLLLLVFFASGAVYILNVHVPVNLFSCAFYIALGILLYGHTRLNLFRWEFPVALAVLCAAAIGMQHSRLTAALVAVGVLSWLARGGRFPTGRVFAGLRYVGQRSYSVYLVHAILGIRLLSGYKFVAKYGDWVAIPLVVLAAAASVAGATVFFRIVEQPCQELARRVRYRGPVTAATETASVQELAGAAS